MKRVFSYPTYLISPHSRLVIYGAGKNGEFLYNKITESGIYDVCGIVDKNYEMKIGLFPDVHPVDWLKSYKEFDFIIVSPSDISLREEIACILSKIGITSEKIVFMESFYSYISNETIPRTIHDEKKGRIRIGFFSYFSGLGDQIITLSVYRQFVLALPDCVIDVWTDNDTFSKAVFLCQSNLGRIILNDGESRIRHYDSYDLFVEISFEILIKAYNFERLSTANVEFAMRVKQHVNKQIDNFVDSMYSTYSDLVLLERARKFGTNRYGLLKGFGLFDDIDDNVRVNICDSAYKKFDSERIKGRIITFSYGANKVFEGTIRQTKMWVPEYYSRLFLLIKNSYPDTVIIQLGDEKASKIDGVDRYFLGYDLETVKCILERSVVHIDCEGGLVHLASHLGTQCIVLFGPTPVDFYGYENNINIVSPLCNGCMGMWKNYQFECLKYGQPICMGGIHPEIVFTEVKKVLGRVYARTI